jgi:glyoxylase-like metal-dependent hydrolase (beta-lactamase superfamily II)
VSYSFALRQPQRRMTDLVFDRNFTAVPGRCEAVTPLVRRVLCGNAGPFTFTGTSSFIVGHGKVAIIDPGPDDAAHLDALLAAVRGETVTQILVTHSHADHSPLAARLKAETGAPILGHGPATTEDGESPRLDAGIDAGFMPDQRLCDGDHVTGAGWTLAAVFTPGHMSNHMCYALREEQSLFSGDHVMSWATSVIAPPDGNMGQYLASLQKLLARDDRFYHSAHGPGRADPLPYVRALLAHRRMREAAILQRLRKGDRHARAIVAALYANVDPRLHGAAAMSVTAHLDHLIARGMVRQTGDGYEPAA